MAFLPASLLLFLLTARPAVSQNVPLHDNSPNCSCYVVEGGGTTNTSSYFQYHRFWDFRSLSPNASQYSVPPPPVNSSQDQGTEPVPNPQYLNSDAWKRDWQIQGWATEASADAPLRMVNTPANVYLESGNGTSPNTTFLTLRTTRLGSFQSAAELVNMQKNLHRASVRIYARVLGAPGAVAGMFTYHDDHNEVDSEVLTQDPATQMRLTNQPALDKKGNVVPQATKQPNMLPDWHDWHEHRLDWLSAESAWFLDGAHTASNSYSVPKKPSRLMINMWSNGGSWSGKMAVGGEALFQIQWVEMVFNTSGPVDGPSKRDDAAAAAAIVDERGLQSRSDKCDVICKIDGVDRRGTPQVVRAQDVSPSSGSSSVRMAPLSWSLMAVIGLVSLAVGWA